MAILGKDERLIEAHSRLLPTTAPPGISRRATTTTPAGSSDSKGRDCGFEICGISPELLARFSQQSRQRDEAIDKFVAENGRRPTDNEVAVLV